MGFPVCYSELLLPRLLLHALLLLGHLHRFLIWSFHAVGLGDLVDVGVNAPLTAQDDAHWHGPASASLQHRRPGFRVDEALPVLRLDELVASSPSVCAGGNCSVCLCGVGGVDEVRRLPNCRHVFHRGCIDRWMAHEQRTCPLCRAPLMPGGDDGAAGASAGLPEVSDYDFPYPSPLPLMPTPTLLLNGLGGFQ